MICLDYIWALSFCIRYLGIHKFCYLKGSGDLTDTWDTHKLPGHHFKQNGTCTLSHLCLPPHFLSHTTPPPVPFLPLCSSWKWIQPSQRLPTLAHPTPQMTWITQCASVSDLFAVHRTTYIFVFAVLFGINVRIVSCPLNCLIIWLIQTPLSVNWHL